MQRNHSIDAIRGTLLLIMSINHFIWITVGWSDIQYLTLQPLGQVGAAEGFIFISGLMVGLIYSGNSRQVMQQKLRHRAKQLYGYHITAILGLLIIGTAQIYFVPPTHDWYNTVLPSLMDNKAIALAASATLIHKPAYFDILPMYVAFLLLAPFVLEQLSKGRVVWILVSSLLVWQSSRFIDLSALLSPYFPGHELNTGYFSWLAWQLVFVVGVCVGYVSRHRPINWFKYKPVVAISTILAITIFFLHRNYFAQYGIHQGTLSGFADKPLLGWLRVLNLFLLVYLFSYLVHLWPNIFAFKPLVILGKHSLQVFTFHYVIIFTLAPVALGHLGFKPNFNLCLVAVALLLFIPPLIKERKQRFNTLKPTRSS